MTSQRPGPGAPGPPGPETSGERARAVGRGLGTGAKVGARGAAVAARATTRATARAGRYVGRQAHRAANAEGADRSGLNRLFYLHFFNTAGDAAVAISLAGSLFFTVPSGEARGQVALFLGLTMLPFAIVAPLIGPFLDRFSHGRRWAIGATMAMRAFLCWGLAGAVTGESAWLFAAALGVLVSSKAYGVTRAAAVPRLLPPGTTLVKANGRVSLAGILGATISAPLAALASLVGPEWSLRYAFVLFVVATVFAIRLPERVDSSVGEEMLVLMAPGGTSTPAPPMSGTSGARPRTRIPTTVAFALRANCGPRWLSGFLLMFMAFLLRDNPPETGLRAEVLIGLVVAAAGIGNAGGVAVASLLHRLHPAPTVVLVLVLDAVAALVATLFYGVLPLVLLGLSAGLAQSLAKFCLDATIQSDVPTQVQASAFARSDTTLQLAWVVGGFVGIALPLDPARLGLGVAFAVLSAWTVFVLAGRAKQFPGEVPVTG
ncbi:Major Facilitator Superfamily protein [Nocardioides dokdonensis FR1436]|uniref:Major Facilitator Superfamily protein n=1 Tax=Nocardioides dokdonensis FR1436 TaxID=1300347 RepID=A0A1A9GGY5_9ACTN|nr:MFS transporter [Nocardioides dokdonensis]ANH36940.1 Major Facilitator Superfamily protein [Nocardioides dokdonensis FR1436]